MKLLFIATLVLYILFSALVGKSQCIDTFDLGNDTSYCDVSNITLDAGSSYIDFLWSTGQTTQTINVNASGSYSCVVHSLSNLNLVSNGDFSSGNTQFSSSYVVGTGGPWGQLSNEGTYAITLNPNLAHNNFVSCGDHTTGTGNMMVVNGASTANTTVWSQTINVNPNTDYDFSAWFTSVVSSNPAVLSFTINGVSIGNSVNLSSSTCFWQKFATSWNSGANNSATIAITNQNTGGSGNDFAIDDIYFAEVCEFTDTINLNFGTTPIVNLGNDTCVIGQIVLHAGNKGNNPPFLYLWSDGSTADSLIVNTTGNYFVTVTHPNSPCTSTDSIIVGVFSKGFLGNDIEFCSSEELTITVKDDGSGQFHTYLWTLDGNTLPDTGYIYHHYELEAGEFILALDIDNGCHDMIKLKSMDCELEIPNIITPNGDGLNDYFVVKHLENYPMSSLVIFNRWGKIVFESNDYKNDWGGQSITDGVYYFQLVTNHKGKDNSYKGTLTVISD